MKTVAILAQKGGVGKTTLSIHLAVAAQMLGLQAAIIDLDPQASAARWRDLRQAETPTVITGQASRLPKFLAAAESGGADLVFLDTAPHSDSIALAAARVADLVLIPTRVGILDLQTVASTTELVNIAQKNAVMIFCSAPVRGKAIGQAKEALAGFSMSICPFPLRDRTSFRTALAHGLAAQEYEPKGKASGEVFLLYEWLCAKLFENEVSNG